jgi:hypothetical protein
VEIHTSLLTNKWHELLVLTTSAYQSIHGTRRMGTTRSDGESAELHQEVRQQKCTCTPVVLIWTIPVRIRVFKSFGSSSIKMFCSHFLHLRNFAQKLHVKHICH